MKTVYICGGKRCGKSEAMRKSLNLSHDEYQNCIERSKSVLQEAETRRKEREKESALLWALGYYDG